MLGHQRHDHLIRWPAQPSSIARTKSAVHNMLVIAVPSVQIVQCLLNRSGVGQRARRDRRQQKAQPTARLRKLNPTQWVAVNARVAAT